MSEQNHGSAASLRLQSGKRVQQLEIGKRQSSVECSCRLAPIGIPTLLIADDPSLLHAGAARFSAWETDDPCERPAIVVHLSRAEMPAANVDFRIAVEGSRVTVMGGGIFGWADARLGKGECAMHGARTGDSTQEFGAAVETLLLFLLARTGRTPIHASSIMIGEQALVLAGPSGTGKSSLALLAAQRGLQVLSDDAIYIQTDPQFRVWGLGGPVHVRPEDAPPDASHSRLRGGKLKLAVPLPGFAVRRSADRAMPILLTPGNSLQLSRIGVGAARQRLMQLEPGFDLLEEESEAAIHALLSADNAWQLTLSREPAEALNLLCDRFAGT